MINASGFKVWPAEVENLMHGHPGVAEACVISAPDAYRGETVKALVVKRAGFDALDVRHNGPVLGLFEPSHMQYEADRPTDPAGEPSLAEMTEKAIRLLQRERRGYFLMVEAGRIASATRRVRAETASSQPGHNRTASRGTLM